jgi:lipocalin-like protein
MNITVGHPARFLSAVMSLLVLMLLGPLDVWAQQKAGTVKDQLVGSWKVLSWKVQTEGQNEWREGLIGPNPKGYVILTANGRYMQLITASGRKPPTNDAERAALLTSMNSLSGRYTVEKDQVVIIVDTSSSEGYQGERQKQVRFFKLEGNKLTWRTPPQIGGLALAKFAKPDKTITEIVMEREK